MNFPIVRNDITTYTYIHTYLPTHEILKLPICLPTFANWRQEVTGLKMVNWSVDSR